MTSDVHEPTVTAANTLGALLRRPRLRAVTQTTVANGAITAVTVVTGVLVARLLKPEGRGALAAIQLYPSLVAVLGLWGLQQTIAIRAARDETVQDRERSLGLAVTCAIFLTVVSIAAYALLCVFVPFPSEALRGLALVWGAAWLPLNFIALALIAIDHGAQRWGGYNLTRMVLSPTYLVLLIILAVLGKITVATVAAALIVANLAVVVARLLFLSRGIRPVWPDGGQAWRQLKGGTGYAFANFSAAATTQIDRVLAVALFDPATVGLYAVALSAASLHSPFSEAVAVNAFAAAARHPRTGGLPRKLFWSAGPILAVCGATALLSPVVLPLVYGKAFAGAVPLAVILSLAGAVTAMATIIDEHYRGAGLPHRGTVARWLGFGCTVLVFMGLRAHVGALAIAFGYAAGQVARFTCLLVTSRTGT